MNLNEYAEAAMKTANPLLSTNERLSNSALGMAGESGEVADLVKKVLHHGHPLDKDKLVKEMGDVLWYIAQMCSVILVPLDEVARQNIEKLARRYANGFTTVASMNRETENTDERKLLVKLVGIDSHSSDCPSYTEFPDESNCCCDRMREDECDIGELALINEARTAIGAPALTVWRDCESCNGAGPADCPQCAGQCGYLVVPTSA